MPRIIRLVLAQRLRAHPALTTLLADFSRIAQVPVRFVALDDDGPMAGAAAQAEPVALCVHLVGIPAICAGLCRNLRQKLRDSADTAPQMLRCDAGLWEFAVPVRVGGQTIGHLLVSGVREGLTNERELNRTRHLLTVAGAEFSTEELARWRTRAPILEAPAREALARLLALGADRLAQVLTDPTDAAPASAHLPPLAQAACRIVHAEYAAPLRLPMIAARLEVSAAHLSRVFHQATGLRFVDYVARFRAERARTLLAQGTERVAAVGAACGFASVSQFNRVFRTHFGQSPRELRPVKRDL
jgi:AraC-like DNA-binding protein